MGVGPSQMPRSFHSLKTTDQCRPSAPHVPFPRDAFTPDGNGLVLDFRALPSEAVIAPLRRTEAETDYWWVDAEFLPGSDAELVVTSSVYVARGSYPWMPRSRFPAGRIFLADFRGGSKLRMANFVGSESSVFPKVQPHPLGQHLAYAGRGSLNLVDVHNEYTVTKDKEIDNAAYHSCALAPNGTSMAAICKVQGMYEVKLYLLDMGWPKLGSVLCHKVCPEFRSSSHNEHVELKWSRDNRYLGVSLSTGVLFLLERGSLSNVLTVCPGELGELSNAGCFDFHPRFCHQLLAVATRDNEVIMFNFEHKAELWSAEVDCGNRTADCLRFDPAGTVVGLVCGDLTVRLLSAEDGSEVWRLDMALSCPPQLASRAPLGHPATMRLAFSQEGGHIATAHCDGHVRVWAVPQLLSLQQFCRQTLLRCHDDKAIRCLPVPEKVKEFLLPRPIVPEVPIQDGFQA